MASTEPAASITGRLIRIVVHGRVLECDPTTNTFRVDGEPQTDVQFATHVKLLGLLSLFMAVIYLDFEMHKFRERPSSPTKPKLTAEEFVARIMNDLQRTP